MPSGRVNVDEADDGDTRTFVIVTGAWVDIWVVVAGGTVENMYETDAVLPLVTVCVELEIPAADEGAAAIWLDIVVVEALDRGSDIVLEYPAAVQ